MMTPFTFVMTIIAGIITGVIVEIIKRYFMK
ncbi:uncharacterized membrane protein (DUF106 family) [Weissella uvarum]|nr:uncharacterized membrane protein (DUF106 family) [Weissella uvarum]